MFKFKLFQPILIRGQFSKKMNHKLTLAWKEAI